MPEEACPLPDPVARAAAILREEGAREVYVFGSRARGAGRPDSDLDLATSGLPAERFISAMSRVVKETRCAVDLIDVDRDQVFVNYLRSKGEFRRVA